MDTSYISPKVRDLLLDYDGSFKADVFPLKNLMSCTTPSLYSELFVVLDHLVAEKKLVKTYAVDRKKFSLLSEFSSLSTVPDTLKNKRKGEVTPIRFSDLNIIYQVVKNG